VRPYRHDGGGFLDYSGLDIDAYRNQRLVAISSCPSFFKLTGPPVLDRD
jgi:3-hydroxybutyryl-CoA dehydrogenase